MKKIFLLLTIAVLSFSNIHAQTIVGKWKCSNDILEGLGLGFDSMKGDYTFYKDGRFKLYIKGRKRSGRQGGGVSLSAKPYKNTSSHTIMYIKASGTYNVENGRITTTVKPNNVKTYVSASSNPPRIPDAQTTNYEYYDMVRKDRSYGDSSYMSETQANMIREEKSYMWSWRNVSITLTPDSLVIGKAIKCRRK